MSDDLSIAVDAVIEIKRLRAEIERLFSEDTKTRHALKGWVFVCPDGGDEPTHERVAAVVAEVEKLREEIKRLRAKIKWLIEDDERLHSVLYRIANPRPFADCPVEMAQNATRGEHLRREAFDGIRRALEGKP